MNDKVKLFFRVKQILVVALLLVAISFSCVGETGAWLVHTSGADSTKLTSASISVQVVGTSVSNAYVQNTGNVPAYIRVAFSVNWVNEKDKNWYENSSNIMNTRQYLARAPKKGALSSTYKNDDGSTSKYDYTYTAHSNWVVKEISEKLGNVTVTYPVFYYKYPVAPGGKTDYIFSKFEYNSASAVVNKQFHAQIGELEYRMTVDFLVDAIQCEDASRLTGTRAVVKEWGVTMSGNNISDAPGTDSM